MSHDLPGPGPEYLDQDGGSPEPGEEAGGARRSLWVGVAVLASVGLVGAAAWGALSLMSTGPQPAEALPARTLGYVSIDLDPTAGQKIEAIRTLKKFPALDEQLGMDAQDDVRSRLFELLRQDGSCPDADYETDVAPWIGSRAAIAAVPRDGTAEPVALLAVEDPDAAEAAIGELAACSAEGGADDAWVVDGDWAVFADTRRIARSVVVAADEKGSLADDDDFQRWTGEVGEPGIVTMYAAPRAGRFLADLAGDAGASGLAGGSGAAIDGATAPLRDFAGAAAVMRFADGALEVESAGDVGLSRWANAGGDGGGEHAATLPATTVAAVSVGLDRGWSDQVMKDVGRALSGGAGDGEATLERQLGRSFAGDLETLLGDNVVLAVGPGLDLDVLGASGDGTGVPVAVRVDSDPKDVERVLGRWRGQGTGGGEVALLRTTAGGAGVAIGPDPAYRKRLARVGALGESEVFRDVLPDADRANVVAFVDLDADDDWLLRMVGDADPAARKNLEPLSAMGAAMWAENGVTHWRLRVTTD
jgi:hypothetical protein